MNNARLFAKGYIYFFGDRKMHRNYDVLTINYPRCYTLEYDMTAKSMSINHIDSHYDIHIFKSFRQHYQVCDHNYVAIYLARL